MKKYYIEPRIIGYRLMIQEIIAASPYTFKVIEQPMDAEEYSL